MKKKSNRLEGILTRVSTVGYRSPYRLILDGESVELRFENLDPDPYVGRRVRVCGTFVTVRG